MADHNKDKKGAENRRTGRISLNALRLNATLAVIERNKAMGCLVPVKDFSKSGAGIYSKIAIDANAVIRLSVEGLNFAPLDGKVVWACPSAGDPHAPPSYPYRIGIEFTPKDDADRDNQIALFEYLSKLAAVNEE